MTDLPANDRLGIRDLQAFHRALDEEKAFDLDMFRNVAYLVEELGEVVSTARQLRQARGLAEEEEARACLGEELSDCLAYLLKLANYAEIDLQAAYVKKMRRNVTRTWPRKPRDT